ncbi:DUF4180 domain-containing protein [Pseudobacteroides cellulosolvens]|uniref:Transcriptional regulator, PadR-like family n=1 Tax=Pseudobacteroides cellulosolvens ATCC 35603 = DSM 2933 TaxID=398512 RepID=A0A0L6JUQ2_9FIRM|nr:DUF4180 domain-containing protein [Pseudobacteroides cellulosolvens]KNY29586.1 transcriptional regulator, PadR-like family [Pseudobacteroides cellulosolvens ATCC 35603 = DSM 2933]
MSIKYAILGLLSWKPFSGYDMKKVFEESSTMYWSGNNNQIYKSLVQLTEEGLVTNEVQHQENSPSKKLYFITEDGLAELKEWVLSSPELPELKNTFLIQLSWAYQLDDGELKKIIANYENSVKMQLVLQQEKIRRGINSPNRNHRETLLWDMINENTLSFYRNEIAWIQNLHKELFGKEKGGEGSNMEWKCVVNSDKKYVECISAANPLGSEQDALDIIALCGDNDTNLLMLHERALSEDFFKLKTKIAGAMLQKFANYRMKVALVISKDIIGKSKFKEMASEANRGSQFRVFNTKEDAEVWLVG